jgi:GNAT superfamily N-acetyltransferase
VLTAPPGNVADAAAAAEPALVPDTCTQSGKSPGMMLRSAGDDDVEALLAVQRAASVAAFAHIYPPDRYPFPDDAIRDVWRQALADGGVETFVAEVDGEPVGSVSVRDDFLNALYVVPEQWRSGIGSALHDHALERLRARGIGVAKLWTLEENWDARRFYERRGWALNGETRIVPFPPHPLDVGYSREL